MSEVDLIDRLAEAVAKRIAPTIPLEKDLWDTAHIAAYFKRAPFSVRSRIMCLPSFPKAVRLPTNRGASQPLYYASEVMEWAAKYKEKN